MTDTTKHRMTIPFIRLDRDRVDAFALLHVDSIHKELEPTMEAITRGVTAWIKGTEEGKAAWDYSSEDLNIGDLLGGYLPDDADLRTCLIAEGIEVESLNRIGDITDIVSYDRVLADTDELECIEGDDE